MFKGPQVQDDMSPKAKYKMKELSNNCEMYDACPVCFKCMNKASHLYERCANCPLLHCAHTHKQRTWVIRRENFAIKVTPKTSLAIAAWVDNGYKKEEDSNE